METIGNVLITSCLITAKKLNLQFSSHTRKLEKRCFSTHKFTPRERIKATYHVYSQLREKLGDSNYNINLSNSKKSILIHYPKRKPLWYRIGLALSDGSLLKQNALIFSVSTSHTIDSIVHAFGITRLYIARLMKSCSTEKVICCFNILVYDKETCEHINILKRGKIPSSLLADEEKKAQFIAGVIEGDGSIDKDNIRISITSHDPIYKILGIILTNHVKYDEKKTMLRLSTKKLRQTNLIEKIFPLLEESHKKENLRRIINKRKRFEIENVEKIKTNNIKTIKTLLTPKDLETLRLFKFRKHKGYTYAFIPVNKKTQEFTYIQIKNLFLKIGKILDIPLENSIKKGNKEIVVYNQHVVSLIQQLIRK